MSVWFPVAQRRPFTWDFPYGFPATSKIRRGGTIAVLFGYLITSSNIVKLFPDAGRQT